jgi:hypothetical protein
MTNKRKMSVPYSSATTGKAARAEISKVLRHFGCESIGFMEDYEQAALRQGHIATNSILRDWIKGQVTAVECGILSFEAVFMPFMLTSDGRPVIEQVGDLLPKADAPKVVQLPPKPGAS